jgi:hypothetical protein
MIAIINPIPKLIWIRKIAKTIPGQRARLDL